MKRTTIIVLALSVGLSQAFPVENQETADNGLGGLISDSSAYGGAPAQQGGFRQGAHIQSTFPLFQGRGFASSFAVGGVSKGEQPQPLSSSSATQGFGSSFSQAGLSSRADSILSMMRTNPYGPSFAQSGSEVQPAGRLPAPDAPAWRVGKGFVPAVPFAPVASTAHGPGIDARNLSGASHANAGSLSRRSHNFITLHRDFGIPQSRARDIVRRELLKRHQQYKRESNTLVQDNEAVPLDPCAGKQGFKHKLCKAKYKMEKPLEEVGGFAKHHAGEIAVGVGVAAASALFETVTLGTGTGAVAAADAVVVEGMEAKNAAKLGEGAIKLGEGAVKMAKGGKSAKDAEKAAEGVEEVGKGMESTAEMGNAATKEAVNEAANSATRGGKLASKFQSHANGLKDLVKQQAYQQMFTELSTLGSKGSTTYKSAKYRKQQKQQYGSGFSRK